MTPLLHYSNVYSLRLYPYQFLMEMNCFVKMCYRAFKISIIKLILDFTPSFPESNMSFETRFHKLMLCVFCVHGMLAWAIRKMDGLNYMTSSELCLRPSPLQNNWMNDSLSPHVYTLRQLCLSDSYIRTMLLMTSSEFAIDKMKSIDFYHSNLLLRNNVQPCLSIAITSLVWILNSQMTNSKCDRAKLSFMLLNGINYICLEFLSNFLYFRIVCSFIHIRCGVKISLADKKSFQIQHYFTLRSDPDGFYWHSILA